MRISLFGSGLICCALLFLGSSALNAQTYGYPSYPDNPYYRGPGYDRSYQAGGGMELFERVEDDLNRAAFDVYGSHRHLNHARKEVADVLHELRRGRFDRDEMGEAISAVEHVVDNDRLPEADRNMLWRDTGQMRRFRDGTY